MSSSDITLIEETTASEDLLKILVATDLHVGFAERDPQRQNDSINTFREVLQIAKKKNVDLILCGGDLFHENKPSREMQIRVTRLLREFCLNDHPVALSFLSDPSANFQDSLFPHANYEDGNLNVGLPVFSIHGNHDDVAGSGYTALDTLHESGLINLFGKVKDCSDCEVSPVLLRKGRTHLALFGIGAQRDDRLARAFRDRSLKLLRPRDDANKWFNLLVLHQNRPKRSETRTTGSYIPESFLPRFLDLVIWAHEHECKTEMSSVAGDGDGGKCFKVLQPGSTVATSLSEEEAVPKHAFLLSVNPDRQYKVEPIKLKTVRQLLWKEIVIDDVLPPLKLPRVPRRKTEEPDEEYLINEVDKMLVEAAKDRTEHQPALPLIRVRVVYTGRWADVERFNIPRFGQNFISRVANPKDIIIFKKKNQRQEKVGAVDRETMRQVVQRHANELQKTVEDIVKDYFASRTKDSDKLKIVDENVLGSAIKEFVSKQENTAIDTKVTKELENLNDRVDKDLERNQPAEQIDQRSVDEIIADQEAAILESIDRMRRTPLGMGNANAQR